MSGKGDKKDTTKGSNYDKQVSENLANRIQTELDRNRSRMTDDAINETEGRITRIRDSYKTDDTGTNNDGWK